VLLSICACQKPEAYHCADYFWLVGLNGPGMVLHLFHNTPDALHWALRVSAIKQY
jgi:hypothetical protein